MVALTAYERVDIELNSGYIGVFSGIPTCQENTLCIYVMPIINLIVGGGVDSAEMQLDLSRPKVRAQKVNVRIVLVISAS